MACLFELAGISTAGKFRNSLYLIGSQERMHSAWKEEDFLSYLSLSLAFIDSPYSARLTLDVTFKIREYAQLLFLKTNSFINQ